MEFLINTRDETAVMTTVLPAPPSRCLVAARQLTLMLDNGTLLKEKVPAEFEATLLKSRKLLIVECNDEGTFRETTLNLG